MAKCRCGHGLAFHRRPRQVSGWLRARRQRPKWLPCQFRSWDLVSTKPRWDGQRCKCRNYHPKPTTPDVVLGVLE